MQLNRQNQARNRQLPQGQQAQSLEQVLTNLLDSYHATLRQNNISLVKDFDNVQTQIDESRISIAVRALVENAIQSMPLGGELSAILIDGSHQWELEIADTVWPSKHSVVRQMSVDDSQLPVILPFPENEYLRTAHRAALEQGGQIQTWKCPLGGTAHVLAVPKQHY